MCGIVGYIGKKQAWPILIKGLHRLEYRGYDSAGIAILGDNLNIYKCKGKVENLEKFAQEKENSGTSGIGHTRWATHGPPNEINAHPHLSESKRLALVHNGIIENYAALKEEMKSRGHRFASETDTEVLAHFIDDVLQNEKVSLAEAVRIALNEVVGAYAIAVISKDDPDTLIAAKKGSPLVIGIGDREFYLASDATPLVEHTRDVVYLSDEEIAILPRDGKLQIKNLKNQNKTPYVQTLELHLEALEKGGFEHFMLKEIFEQPRSIRDSMRGRLRMDRAEINLGGVSDYIQKLINAKRIIIVACGTSLYAGMIGKYLLEDLAKIPAATEYASEFRYRNQLIEEGDIVIAISQSGETADTLNAIKLAKAKGAIVLGICNVVGSSLARATDAGSYIHAGPEIGVASTKAFTAQVAVLSLLALEIAHKKGAVSESKFQKLLTELNSIPEKAEWVLKKNEEIKNIAKEFKDAKNVLYLGRNYGLPVALEGALKLKEISYIHAEGYPAGEMKHGPIALIDQNMPVVVIATKDAPYEKVLNDIQETKTRKGRVLAVVTEGDSAAKKAAEYAIEVPGTEEVFSPLISVIPLQLLAYHLAVLLGRNVDQPRNLAKSVTVE